MIIIPQNIKDLIKNIPKEVSTKLNISYVNLEELKDTIQVTVIYFENQKARESVVELGGIFEDLGYNYAIVTIDTSKIIELARLPAIQYIEFPKSLYFGDYDSNKAACIIRARESFKLNGEGVIIGFIDSGIDYTHPAFMDDEGNTRIKYIYDSSVSPAIVYTQDDINVAIKNQNPYSIVPVYDNTGHGTHVVGIAAAGGKINKNYYGVAPKASIIMVKSGRGYYSLSTSIMRGIKFLVDKSYELDMPLVINMSLSTNDGAHDGKSLLEQYINTVCKLNRITVVVAAGNEGNAGHHKGGKLENDFEVKFNVAPGEYNIIINLYKSILPQISINLITPAGVSTGEIEVREGYKDGVISGNKYQIYNSGPKPFDINGEIGISLNNNGREILFGIWTIRIKVLNNYDGIYDMWLPIAEGLNKGTKFLSPTIDNTLGIPATVYNVISVGSYNYQTRTISPFSGRGEFTLKGNIEPEVVAPGADIIAPIPQNSYDRKTGTSMATPHVSGAAALMMQWGIIKGNDPYLYGERLKHYLILGARRQRLDIRYPDTAWGYGELCLDESINTIIDVLGIITGSEFRDNSKKRFVDTNKYSNFGKYIENIINNSDEIVSSIFEFSSMSQFDAVKELPNTTVIELSSTYGIVYTPLKAIPIIRNIVKKLFFYYEENLFTLAESSPIDASNAPLYQDGKLLDLTGQGVIIGIIDTGIDYLSKEFQNEDGTTRILSIWDQTLPSKSPVIGLNIGQEFSKDQINKAIKAHENGDNPYDIVASKDTIGHGTMVASIAAAKGVNRQVRGVAYDSSIAVVKLKPEGKDRLELSGITKPNVNAYNDISILCGIIYLKNLAKNLDKPIVVLIPLETNSGAHDGTSILCGIMNVFASQLGVLIVTGSGNQGDKDIHTESVLKQGFDTKEIELMVGKNQDTLAFTIWIQKPNIMSLDIISPSGQNIGKIPIRSSEDQNVEFVFEKTLMSVRYTLSNEQNGDESIFINAIGLKPGIWKFRLYGEYVVDGKYGSWLPQSELLYEGTKFISPNGSTTVSDAGTAQKVISVAYYNQNSNSVVASSGRGFTWDGRVKPSIAAGGINAKVIKPGGVVSTASGSSVATSVVGGICAMILQWGVIEGNEPNIYDESIITYIIRGAKKRPGDRYPNEQWGYGTIDVDGIFEAIRGNYRLTLSYDEYYVNNLFVRIPINLNAQFM